MQTTKLDIIRRCRFQPYRKGYGPTFRLTMWDTHRTGEYGKACLGYRLEMIGTCNHPDSAKATCGKCNRSWCVDCDPGPSALCHYCNGSTATKWKANVKTVLFEGEDLFCSPMHAIDSDESVADLMSFLTLRPGDTDSEYFANYTSKQLEYCDQHAESLSCCVNDRFGWDS